MANPFKSPRSTNLGLLLVRLPLGAIFCIEGYQKLATVGLAKFVAEHVKMVPRYMPPWFPKLFLSVLPFAEMGLGAFIVIGLLTRLSGFLLSCLLVSFLMITGVHDATGRWPFHPNFVFLGIALLTLFAGGGGMGIDARLFKPKSAGYGAR